MVALLSAYRRLALAGVSAVLLAWPLATAHAHRQTTGPTQPEFQSIGGATATELVDPFTGDFRYTIPLFELPGPNGRFPFVLSYQSGFGTAQEASWVGLGWSLNPGLISRQMRGLPDDMNGDTIWTQRRSATNWTFGTGAAAGLEVFGGDATINLGFRAYYNNYRGLGVTADLGVATSVNNLYGSGLNADVGLRLSLNSDEGASVMPSLSLAYGTEQEKRKYEGSFNASLNSRTGLTDLELGGKVQALSVSTNLRAFANSTHIPTLGRSVSGQGVNVRVKVGGEVWGVYGNLAFSLFVQRQRAIERFHREGYGFLYLDNANGDDAVMDLNREKDGLIRKKTPNLAIPILTNDLYVASGQGFSGTFRAFRSDVGILHDPKDESNSWSVTTGYEIGVGVIAHWGIDGSLTTTNQESGAWHDENTARTTLTFHGPSSDPTKERVFFAMVGEQAIMSAPARDVLGEIGGEGAVRLQLDSTGSFWGALNIAPPEYQKFILTADYEGNGTATIQNPAGDRQPRGTVIAAFTNGDLKKVGSAAPEFAVEFIDSDGSRKPFPRDSRPDAHIGAFVVLTPDGTRHIYALPTYNLQHEERQFSVTDQDADTCGPTVSVTGNSLTGTDQYSDSTALPPYSTAHLLTAVLGPDYVDADLQPGPSDGDFGYWVKFTYQRTTSGYQWRAPYREASFLQGFRNEGYLDDDKASFMWGEKELWYLRSAETKTHVAEFRISQRRDAAGARNRLQTGTGARARTYKLDSIAVFSKDNRSEPIKRVRFDYTYQLSSGIPNFDSLPPDPRPGFGKLTLKRVWFENEKSRRGALSPYEFGYDEANPSANPPYKEHAHDRWGMYRRFTDFCSLAESPYVPQDPASTAKTDTAASVWHLRVVRLPSGGRILVDYEADRYGWVQNRRATAMVRIAGFDAGGSDSIVHAASGAAGGPNRRVFFDLRDPTNDTAGAAQQLARYVEGLRQVYFKACMYLKPGYDECEFVTGYAGILASDLVAPTTPGGNYTRAWVELGGATDEQHHSISVAAWQHLRLNQPELLRAAPFGITSDGSPAGEASKLLMLVDPVTWAAMIAELVKGFNDHAHDERWGRRADLARSWIRLNVPTRSKMGGGVRVRRVLLIDAWDESTTQPTEPPDTIGQVFHYVLADSSSSGVVDYEPSVGGDENPMRTARQFSEDLTLASDYNLFFEYPINESYFPGSVVGYSRVVMRTLTSERLFHQQLPVGTPTTGMSVRTFYTAKDYPVRTDETLINRKPVRLWFPIPLIGQLAIDNLTASQGYAIQLNDMHGKPRTVEEYEGNIDGTIRPGPLSSVEYRYYATASPVPGDRIEFDLNNTVPVLDRIVEDVNGEPTPHLSVSNRVVGRQVDFFVDAREASGVTTHIGVAFNSDVLIVGFFPVPVPVPWPTLGRSISVTRTAVTNKVVFKSGVLREVVSRKEGALTNTAMLAFDPLVGRTLFGASTNAFEDSVFSLSMPARWFFHDMGPGFVTTGLRFSAHATALSGGGRILIQPMGSATSVGQYVSIAAPGDEFAVVTAGVSTRGRVDSIDVTAGTFVIDPDDPVATADVELILLRSGRRNLLSSNASELRALANPVTKRRYAACQAQYTYPCKQDEEPTAAHSVRVSRQAAAVLGAFADVKRSLPPGTRLSLATLQTALGICWNTSGGGVRGPTNVVAPNIATVPVNAVVRLQLRNGKTVQGQLVGRRRGAVIVRVAATTQPRAPPSIRTIRELDVTSGSTYDRRRRSWQTMPTVSLRADGTVAPGAPRVIVAPSGGVTPGTIPTTTDCPPAPSCDWSLLDSLGHTVPKEALTSFDNAYPLTPPKNGLMTDPSTGLGYTGLAAVAVWNGQRVEVFIYSNCPWTERAPPETVPGECVKTETDYFEVVDSVISITGTGYSGAWPQYYDDLQFSGTEEDVVAQQTALINGDAFANGQAGLWHPERHFAYVDDRLQSDPINIRRDGTFNNVTLFDGGSDRLLECAPKWRLATRVTRHNPYAFVTESEDILKISTAALYGYRGSLNTAYAKNARYDEIGFDGFEEYVAGQDVGFWNRAAGNIDIRTRAETEMVTFETPVFEIYDAYRTDLILSPRAGSMSAFARGGNGFPPSFVDSVEIFPEARAGPLGAMDRLLPRPGRYGVSAYGLMPDGRPFVSIDERIGYTPVPDGGGGGRPEPGLPPVGGFDPAMEILKGKIRIIRIQYGGGVSHFPRRVGIVDVVATKAHTGRNSFMVAEPDSFAQPRLRLAEGHAYVLSAWVSRDSTDVGTYRRSGLAPLGIEIQFLDLLGEVISRHPTLAEPDGPIIEGWQRIELTFTMNNAHRIGLRFQNGTDGAGAQVRAYFDDLRVFPADATMETYVYDPRAFRLVALLDNNNFAQLFGYDDEGTLHLVRRETMRGIMTIQETRMHLRERP